MLIEIVPAMLHATILSFGLIMPLGVQNIFIFNQGSSQPSLLYALPSMITAACCDSLLILLGISGVSLFVFEILWVKAAIFSVGSLFLFYIGYNILQKNHTSPEDHKIALPIRKQIVFTASLSFLNPHAIVDTIVVIGTSAIAYEGNVKLAYTVTCILISWIWFFAVGFAGHKLNQIDENGKALMYINKLSAIIMWFIGLSLAWQAYNSWKAL